MSLKKRGLNAVLSTVVVIGLATLVSSCDDGDKTVDTGGQTPDSSEGRSKYLPYSVRFDLKGNPVLVDEKGREVPMEEQPFPLKAEELQSLQTFSVVTYKGSCKQVYCINGKYFVVNLPPAACGQ